MAKVHSSSFGWQAGQDITDVLPATLEALEPGTTFVFDHMYDVGGSSIELANNVTLQGATQGAGLNVTDTLTNSRALIHFGRACTLRDLTVIHSNAGPKKSGKLTFRAFSGDLKIFNSSFSGGTGRYFDVSGNNLLVEDSHFDGGYYQMRWGGATSGFIVKRTLFENSLGDGIKTERGDGVGAQNHTVQDSVFLNNARDGIDTTGGWKNCAVVGCFFIGNGVTGIDLKNIFENESDVNTNHVNRFITIANCYFLNHRNHIVLSTLDRITYSNDKNVQEWLVRDVLINDSTFENTTMSHNMVFSKGAFNVHAENVTLLGPAKTYREQIGKYLKHINPRLINTNLTAQNITKGAARTSYDDEDYRTMVGPRW